jgi:hypothetical protein
MNKELEEIIDYYKTKIRDERLKIKNLPDHKRWLAPMMRGTVETMEKTLKILEDQWENLK